MSSTETPTLITVETAVDFDNTVRKEVFHVAHITASEAQQIIQELLQRMSYDERKRWLGRHAQAVTAKAL